MKLRITHETLYHYTPTVETAQHVAHLHPPITPCQSCQHHQLSTEPEATQVSSNIDAFGNHRLYWSLPSPHSTLKVTAKSELETFPIEDNRLNALEKQMLHLPWENAVLAYRYRADIASDEATEFAYASHHAPIDMAFAIYAQSSFPPGRNLIESDRKSVV